MFLGLGISPAVTAWVTWGKHLRDLASVSLKLDEIDPTLKVSRTNSVKKWC